MTTFGVVAPLPLEMLDPHWEQEAQLPWQAHLVIGCALSYNSGIMMDFHPIHMYCSALTYRSPDEQGEGDYVIVELNSVEWNSQ